MNTLTGKTESVRDTTWSYEQAFSRNLGLINPAEQKKLKGARIAIAGMGGVGGVHLMTLARLGVGSFTIADFDTFEIANTNRQYGAFQSTLGKSKVAAMAQAVLDVNPHIHLRAIDAPIDASNVDHFLEGADILIDGIDAFEVDVRRLLFRKAAERGIYAISAGPIGFGTAWLVFDPNGMTFDRYFDLSDGMDAKEKFIAFITGMIPKAAHRTYMDSSYINIETCVAPSSSVGCQLAAGVAAATAIKILLKRGALRPAPHYAQFDAYTGVLVQGTLWSGNRHPLQRLKRWWLQSRLKAKARSQA